MLRRSLFASVTLALILTMVAGLPAHAETIATGTFAIDGSLVGTLSWDDVTYAPFGVPLNFGVSIGSQPLAVTSLVAVDAFHGVFQSEIDADPQGIFQLHANGVDVCPPTGCQSGAPISLITTSTSASGSAIGGLPSDVVFASDGYAFFSNGGYVGTLAINGFRTVPTPPGIGVTTSHTPTYFDSATQSEVAEQVDVTFDTVTGAGTTLVTASSNAAATIPTNFAVAAGGYTASFFDVTTTAVVTPPFTVCQHYADADGDGFVDGTTIDENSLRILHAEGVTFTDVTTSHDVGNNVVCGQTTSLSPFVVAVLDPPVPPACVEIAKGKLSLSGINTAAADDKLKAKGAVTVPYPFMPGLDPSTRGVLLTVTSAGYGTIVSARVPAIKFTKSRGYGWKVNKSRTTWTYVNKASNAAGGINTVILKDQSKKTPGLLTFSLSGSKMALPGFAFPLTTTIVFDPPVDGTGQCGRSTLGHCTAKHGHVNCER